MPYSGKILVFKRSDLHLSKRSKLGINITTDDLKVTSAYTQTEILKADILLFIDDNGTTHILKNRWGNEGIIVANNIPAKLQSFTWTRTKPKKEGYYWVMVRGELSGKIYEHIVKVYESQSGKSLVFYDGENFSLEDDRFIEWSTEPINKPLD